MKTALILILGNLLVGCATTRPGECALDARDRAAARRTCVHAAADLEGAGNDRAANTLRARACLLGEVEACRRLKNASYASPEARAQSLRVVCAGSPLFCDALAECYRTGDGVPRDEALADEYEAIRRAAFHRSLAKHPALFASWRRLGEQVLTAQR